MAHANYASTTASAASLRDVLSTRIAAAREGWGRWRLYRRTLDELSALSNRDLADLGLSRASIRAVAFEAAYGK